jgi:hypothetical protein
MGDSVEKMCSCSWTVLWRILTLCTDIINKFKNIYIYFMTFGTHLIHNQLTSDIFRKPTYASLIIHSASCHPQYRKTQQSDT